MDSQTYIEAFDTEGARLVEVAASSLDLVVPSCPGWDVAQLATHVGQVYGFVTGVLSSAGSTARPSPTPVQVPDDRAALAGWLGELHQGLGELLRATDPDTPAWNWAGTGSAGFFHRRMAQETLIHRWDVEGAAGDRTPIDSDLATDGVDELIEVGMRFSTNPAKEFSYPDGSLHLHRTDGEGQWLLRTEDGELVVSHEHAKGDAAVRGTGDNLLLFMWGRGGEGLEIFGDQTVADAWARFGP